MYQASPGVERAVEAARAWAERLGAGPVRLADVVLGLLDEEEGHPAVLVARLGLTPAELRDAFRTTQVRDRSAIAVVEQLYDAARNWSITWRADPAFLTDALLLVTLRHDPEFRSAAAAHGLEVDRVEQLLTARAPQEPPEPVLLGLSEDFTPTPDSPGEGREPEGLLASPLLDDKMAGSLSPSNVTEQMDAARVLDANFNRAREALRVLEDFCRFVLDDRFLTGEVKALRHRLRVAAARLPTRLLLAARDTFTDVGTTVSANGEYVRRTAVSVAQANLKRAQEAVRTLEEFGKLFDPELGRKLEAIRYGTYTLERAVILGATARERLRDVRLYVLLTQSQARLPLAEVVRCAAAGGADVFQLREKNLAGRELLERACEIREATRQAGVLFIVNDRPDVARAAGADGVHLGQDDLSIREARRILGPDALIGVSTHSMEQLRQAMLEGADYVGIGPTFPSKTKAFEQFAGLEFVRAATAETSLPAFALGGIGPENVAQVVAAGGRRVAVSAAIAGAEDPEPAARVLRTALVR